MTQESRGICGMLIWHHFSHSMTAYSLGSVMLAVLGLTIPMTLFASAVNWAQVLFWSPPCPLSLLTPGRPATTCCALPGSSLPVSTCLTGQAGTTH